MKKYFIKNKSLHKVFGICASGVFFLSSCGSYTSVTPSEAYDAGYTIGRIISGN